MNDLVIVGRVELRKEFKLGKCQAHILAISELTNRTTLVDRKFIHVYFDEPELIFKRTTPAEVYEKLVVPCIDQTFIHLGT